MGSHEWLKSPPQNTDTLLDQHSEKTKRESVNNPSTLPSTVGLVEESSSNALGQSEISSKSDSMAEIFKALTNEAVNALNDNQDCKKLVVFVNKIQIFL